MGQKIQLAKELLIVLAIGVPSFFMALGVEYALQKVHMDPCPMDLILCAHFGWCGARHDELIHDYRVWRQAFCAYYTGDPNNRGRCIQIEPRKEVW